MHPRAEDLVRELGLRPHPEGGYFREIFRSTLEVRPGDGRPARAALTSIYFLLDEDQHSRWHRVVSDEAWHFYEGDPLELFWVGADDSVHRELLSQPGDGGRPAGVVPAGCWQAARALGSYALVGCTVGPGFDFEDFEMITGTSPVWERLRSLPGIPSGLL